jgi:hypothetical protein
MAYILLIGSKNIKGVLLSKKKSKWFLSAISGFWTLSYKFGLNCKVVEHKKPRFEPLVSSL